MSVNVTLKANVGDIVYLPIPTLPLPARREVVEIRMHKHLTTYTLQNNRTGETEVFDDIDFGVNVFTDLQDAKTALGRIRHV